MDRSGQPVYGAHGKRVRRYAADDATIQYALMAFDLFTNRLWSGADIAREFNRLAVAGRTSWSSQSIMKILRIREASGAGEKPNRGRYSRIGIEKLRQMRELIRQGINDSEVAEQVGVGRSSVQRERKRLEAEQAEQRDQA